MDEDALYVPLKFNGEDESYTPLSFFIVSITKQETSPFTVLSNVNVTVRMDPLFFNKSDDSKWTIDIELLETLYPEAFEILEKIKNFL